MCAPTPPSWPEACFSFSALKRTPCCCPPHSVSDNGFAALSHAPLNTARRPPAAVSPALVLSAWLTVRVGFSFCPCTWGERASPVCGFWSPRNLNPRSSPAGPRARCVWVRTHEPALGAAPDSFALARARASRGAVPQGKTPPRPEPAGVRTRHAFRDAAARSTEGPRRSPAPHTPGRSRQPLGSPGATGAWGLSVFLSCVPHSPACPSAAPSRWEPSPAPAPRAWRPISRVAGWVFVKQRPCVCFTRPTFPAPSGPAGRGRGRHNGLACKRSHLRLLPAGRQRPLPLRAQLTRRSPPAWRAGWA